MKIKHINPTIEWQTIKNINFFNTNSKLPAYNITIKNEDTVLEQILDTKDYIYTEDRRFSDDINLKKPKFYSSQAKNSINHTYTFHFIKNYGIYKKIYNKLGFFKNLKFIIDYVDTPDIDYQFDIQYCEIENLNQNSLLNKIYRSNDLLSLKLLINIKHFQEKEISSILILGSTTNQNLKSILIEEIDKKWLNVNQETALLTIPFIENEIVEISDKLNVKIIPLNNVQSQIYNFLKSHESEEKINKMFEEFFPNQIFNIENVGKQIENNETLIVYQNYIYLFNKDSLNSNSLDLTKINEIEFNKYYPLLNKSEINKTICINCDVDEDSHSNNLFNLNKDYLGYFYKDLDLYRDINSDLNTLISKNIRQVKILEINEENNICDLYIEFITNFYNNEKFYIETSRDLKFYEKYYSKIDNKDYITFLFKYSYDLIDLNNYLTNHPNENRSQIISGKSILNFTGKIIL